ncbi:copper amine oxidase N-terminal domain-containing protein [Microaerobacter geothermalis]|uniref:copper amine oxidase N-terminal domain-containing protein n=1 Tax=Microaerobacter geothermalis TaxID=674972 RepID=UPI001F43195E|nr:copper amine oxidase N-terminal domain-containing protein [Microaerobacter geothermalis]MCF6094061.1 copper amine oxidase N-terminal domain-containing protein [Microaerobacter geothermalis]
MITRSKKIIAAMLMLLILLSLNSAHLYAASSASLSNTLFARYTSPEGINFDSYSTKWDRQKLKQLYEVFIKNPHSSELSVLSTVKLSPEEPIGEAGNVTLSWTIDRYGKMEFKSGQTITLFQADRLTSVEELSFALNHEYGHLFTYYWLIKKENKLPVDPSTEWAKIRKLNGFPIRWENSKLEYDHFWQPEEIMADDYAILFGAPEGKTGIKENTLFQIENTLIPPAENVPGLREYWAKLSGIQVNLQPLYQPELTSFLIRYVDGGYGKEPVYTFSFTPARENPSTKDRINYFLIFSEQNSSSVPFVYGQSDIVQGKTTIQYGTKIEGNRIYRPFIPKEKGYIRIYAFDTETKQMTYSPMYWYDFRNPFQPKAIPNQFERSKINYPVSVFIDNIEQFYDQQPVIVNGSTLVPLRGIFETLGADITWDGANRTVTAVKGDAIIVLQIGNALARINGKPIILRQKPEIINNRTMVPLRFVSEALGARVDWEGASKSVFIVTKDQ